jgi:hypothetical protein
MLNLMLRRRRQTRSICGFAALYALAMILLGFAHRPLAIGSIVDVELAAYALPDGSLPSICGQDGDRTPAQRVAAHICDACALAAAPGLVAAPEAFAFIPTVRVVALAGESAGQHSPSTRHAPTSRGPPLA